MECRFFVTEPLTFTGSTQIINHNPASYFSVAEPKTIQSAQTIDVCADYFPF